MITVLFGLVAAYELGAGVTPVQKVIQMMQEMTAKGKQEKHDEQVRFATFSQFCVDTMDQKQAAIATAADAIEQLQADIQKAQADQQRLGGEITVLDENIGAWEADKAKAEDDRAAEKADYDLLHKDYSESIDAIGRAVVTLKGEAKDSPQALLQVASLTRTPAPAKRTILAFLQSKGQSDPLSVSAPQADAYVFQSGGIIDMLEKLQDKFKAELEGYTKEDMQAKHAHTMLVQQLVDNIAAATEERERKTIEKTKRAEAEGTATGDLATTKADKKADESYLKDLKAECDQKSRDYESRQTLRAEELEAIAKATEIISSGAVSGNSEKHLPQLVQTSFGLRSSTTSRSPLVAKAASFLMERSRKTNSHLLALVASKVQSDPFAKVKKMIKDMIVKLMEEATEESEHKGWCDTELGTNKQTRDNKADAVATLTAAADELGATIAKLGNEIAELSDGIASIDAAVAEATSLRMEEKAKNAETVKDAGEAQVAVAKALTVLQDFYAMAADATALVQGAADDAPATFDGAYQGMGASSGGVVGMLEVIESDFARLEAETNTAESEAASEFEKFSNDSDLDKSVKQMDLDNKGKDKTTAEGDLVATKKDLGATQEELDAALVYYEKLKPACVDAGLSYEDRVRQREEEIQSLQEALKILSGDAI